MAIARPLYDAYFKRPFVFARIGGSEEGKLRSQYAS
jgi:hypothetical protein